jgi:hypothetical protein
MNHVLPHLPKSSTREPDYRRSLLSSKLPIIFLLLLLCSCPGRKQKIALNATQSAGATSGPILGDGASCNAAAADPCPAGLSCMTPKPCPKGEPCKQEGICHLRCNDKLPCFEGFVCQDFSSGAACIPRE